MTILQINAVYNLSSTGRTTSELHNFLLQKGINSYVAYSNTNKPNDKNLYHIGSKADVKIHAFFSRLSGKQAYFSRLATYRLLKFIDKIRPDIVHFRNLHGNYINFPMLMRYLAKRDIAVVVTFHDFWTITGKCAHFVSSGCKKWLECCGDCPDLSNGNPTWFFDRSQKMLKDKKKYFGNIKRLALIGVSDWVCCEVKKSPIAKNAVVKRIYNWIDFEKFYPFDASEERKKLGFEDKTVILGVSAKWNDKKGLADFTKLAEMLDEKKVILLVGYIPKGTVLPENVISAGSTNSEKELAECYNLADVFVTFSREETFGKVSAEALSCGTPVICYDCTACPEIVGDGCGYIEKKGDVAAAYRDICLIEKKGKEFYGESCVRHARANYDKNLLINEYIELYKELLNL